MSIINLLPEDYLTNRARARTNLLCLGLFLVVMAGIGTAYAVSQQTIANTRAVRDRVEAAYTHAAKLIGQMHQLEDEKRTMLQKAEATASLVERVPRSTVLGVITDALPKGASLTKVVLTTRHEVRRAPVRASNGKGSKFKAAQAKARARQAQVSTPIVEMQISGLARTDMQVAHFIARLAGSALAKSVDLVYSQQELINKVPVRQFCVKMELRNDADAIEAVRQVKAEAHPNHTKAPIQKVAMHTSGDQG